MSVHCHDVDWITAPKIPRSWFLKTLFIYYYFIQKKRLLNCIERYGGGEVTLNDTVTGASYKGGGLRLTIRWGRGHRAAGWWRKWSQLSQRGLQPWVWEDKAESSVQRFQGAWLCGDLDSGSGKLSTASDVQPLRKYLCVLWSMKLVILCHSSHMQLIRPLSFHLS